MCYIEAKGIISVKFPVTCVTSSNAFPLPRNAVFNQMGKTKVFLRAGQDAQLDARRAEVLAKAARHIQRQIHTLLTRKEFITLRNATIHIQKIWRGQFSSQN